MFLWEYGIALHAMQGNRATFPSDGDVSYDLSSCSNNLMLGETEGRRIWG